MAHNARGWMTYTSSNPTIYGATLSIKGDDVTAGNNFAPLLTTPAVNVYWPAHHGDLRAVYGIDTAAKVKDTCINLNSTNALYNLGASFVDQKSNSYTVNGLRAERVRFRNFK